VALGNSTLQVTMLPGYTPGSTDSFAIITNAASIGGVFTGMNNNSRISLGNGYMATITYTSTAVTLSNLSRGASGSTILFW